MDDFQPCYGCISSTIGYWVVMYPRYVASRLLEGLDEAPAVYLSGPRQCGKSTLVQRLARERPNWHYATLDEDDQLAYAADDPAGFLGQARQGVLVVDEVQRVPRLFLALKHAIDSDRRPSRFVLTGSASLDAYPALADALVGRMDPVDLGPLAQVEIDGRSPNSIVDGLLAGEVPRPASTGDHEPDHGAADVEGRVRRGGFPDAVAAATGRSRANWFRRYVSNIIRGELADMSRIERIADLPRLLRTLAFQSSSLLNHAGVSRDLGIPVTTIKRYVALLQALMIVDVIPAYQLNPARRSVKSPKLAFVDSGLLCHVGSVAALPPHLRARAMGAALETFVWGELRRHCSWSHVEATLHHFRTEGGAEVDLVLEGPTGSIVGIEVKSGASLGERDLRGMKLLAREAAGQFVQGIVLYGGDRVREVGRGIHAVPLRTLWS